MLGITFSRSAGTCVLVVLLLFTVSGCGAFRKQQVAEPAGEYEYLVGPGDTLNIFVWRNEEISVTGVPVRPDGMISSPLVEDMPASGKTPAQLARDIESVLSKYVKDPLVTITVTNFSGEFNQQVRVVGEAVSPQAIPFRKNMTVLDVMIAAGGLTEFAAGNKATLIRNASGKQVEIKVRLEDLLKDGDITANVRVAPGDILIIPESFF
jgi:polysaccharide export outer membrane protein